MKKVLVCLIALAMFSPVSFAGKKKTEIEKCRIQIQALVRQKGPHIQALNLIELEIIKVQAVLDYLSRDKKNEKK
jgi:hypothetical protein